MLCQDNVRSRGCEPPASLTKKEEHPVPTSLCGKHCTIIKGECICIPKPSPPISLCPKDCTLDEGICVCPMERRAILETRAVDGTKPNHALSPRDNEEGLLCHKERGCNRWQGNLPPAEAEVISKRDINHPALSQRDVDAEPTITQTSTTPHFATPTATIKACPDNYRPCQGSFLTNPPQEFWYCRANDRECLDIGHFPLAKAEKEEKRDVDIVPPPATGTSEVKIPAACFGTPYLCLDAATSEESD